MICCIRYYGYDKVPDTGKYVYNAFSSVLTAFDQLTLILCKIFARKALTYDEVNDNINKGYVISAFLMLCFICGSDAANLRFQ